MDLVPFAHIGLPGRGPWKVEPDCPAPYHNTTNAGRGRPGGFPRCICPRALFLVAEFAERDNGERRRKRNGTEINKAAITGLPDMSQGACTTDEYREVARAGQTEDANLGAKLARENAVAVCAYRCPIIMRCRSYILTAEKPAGSWGGVWGGLEPDDRRRLARAR